MLKTIERTLSLIFISFYLVGFDLISNGDNSLLADNFNQCFGGCKVLLRNYLEIK